MDKLFDVLNTDVSKRNNVPNHLAKFEYVNGGLFKDAINLIFSFSIIIGSWLGIKKYHHSSNTCSLIFTAKEQRKRSVSREDGELFGLHFLSANNLPEF